MSSPLQFKVTLSELVQREHLPLPQYEEVSVKGPAHKREFTIKCSISNGETTYERFGRGHSKKLAESDAAANMLSFIETQAGGRGLPGYEVSTFMYVCRKQTQKVYACNYVGGDVFYVYIHPSDTVQCCVQDGATIPRASGGLERTIVPNVLSGVEVDYVDMIGENGTFLCLASTDTLAAHGFSTDNKQEARHIALQNLKLSVIDLSQ